MFYIYAYLRSKDSVTAKAGTPYYIGKGHGNRAFEYRKNVSTPKDKFYIKLLETNLSEIGAFALERRYIEWWGRKDLGTGILLNRTDGGEGATGKHPAAIGKKRSDDVRKKMSEIRKSTPLSLLQLEHLRQMSENNKGRESWNSGVETGPRTDEQIQNNRNSQLERWAKAKKERDAIYLENPSLCEECGSILSFRRRKYRFCDRICSGKNRQK